MDKTITYVNMADNEFIQRMRTHLELGDYWCWASNPEKIMLCHSAKPVPMTTGSGNRKIWLPTQSQLQHIEVSARKPDTLSVTLGYLSVEDLNQFYINCRLKLHWNASSWEQLWLAYAMQKIFHQVLTRGVWVSGEV